ncbi:MAG: hypothetical protein AAF390_07415 [Pseudomonadota bacterium]
MPPPGPSALAAVKHILASIVGIVLSRFVDRLGRIITPEVTGIVITVTGLGLGVTRVWTRRSTCRSS